MPEEASSPKPASYPLAATVYAERDGQILLLKRAGGALSGQWYLPGGMVDEGELPEEGARRELMEESGLAPDGPLHLIGLYPMRMYGHLFLNASYACLVGDGEVAVSHEHSGARWVTAEQMRASMTDDALATIAGGHDPTHAALSEIRNDLDRYIAWRALR